MFALCGGEAGNFSPIFIMVGIREVAGQQHRVRFRSLNKRKVLRHIGDGPAVRSHSQAQRKSARYFERPKERLAIDSAACGIRGKSGGDMLGWEGCTQKNKKSGADSPSLLFLARQLGGIVDAVVVLFAGDQVLEQCMMNDGARIGTAVGVGVV